MRKPSVPLLRRKTDRLNYFKTHVLLIYSTLSNILITETAKFLTKYTLAKLTVARLFHKIKKRLLVYLCESIKNALIYFKSIPFYIKNELEKTKTVILQRNPSPEELIQKKRAELLKSLRLAAGLNITSVYIETGIKDLGRIESGKIAINQTNYRKLITLYRRKSRN